MELQEIIRIRELQRGYFKSGSTLNVNRRIGALKELHKVVKERESDICEALMADLGKSNFESFMCEVGLVLDELSYMIRNTRKFAKEHRVKTPLAQFHSISFRKPSPLGTVLIMSPWNYPFMLTMSPLVDALAAGNTAMVKPSAYSPATSQIIKEIIEECFDEEYVAVVTGGRAENQYLLDQQFDFIFFTGSKTVGKLVMNKASVHLTPIVLELGGKSPVVVDKSANIKMTARRLVFGKYLNVGQTCVAPDYVLCHESVEEEFLEAVVREIKIQFGEDTLHSDSYGKIINEKHFDRITGLIDPDKVYYGGASDRETRKIEPTVMRGVTWDDAVMGEEIFGPVMPVMTYSNLDDAISMINDRPHPLAVYAFGRDKSATKRLMRECLFGGGCINDTIIHLATTEMGFGGVGDSGMGQYHGRIGFNTFSHVKSIVDKKLWLDLPMRYQPYKGIYLKMLHMIFR